MGEAGCRDNPADILSRKCNHLNVKEINPVSTQTVHSGEIEVKHYGIQKGGRRSHAFETTLALDTLFLGKPSLT